MLESEAVIHCLVEAPSAEATIHVDLEAHGPLGDAIFQVKEGS